MYRNVLFGAATAISIEAKKGKSQKKKAIWINLQSFDFGLLLCVVSVVFLLCFFFFYPRGWSELSPFLINVKQHQQAVVTDNKPAFVLESAPAPPLRTFLHSFMLVFILLQQIFPLNSQPSDKYLKRTVAEATDLTFWQLSESFRRVAVNLTAWNLHVTSKLKKNSHFMTTLMRPGWEKGRLHSCSQSN